MANFTPDTLRIKTRTTSSVTPLSNLLNKEIIIDEKGTTGTELVFKDSTGTIVSIAGRSALGSIASGKGAELIGLNISGLTGSNVKDVIGSMKTIIDSTVRMKVMTMKVLMKMEYSMMVLQIEY